MPDENPPPPYEQIDASAIDLAPFANGTEWEMWSHLWCANCQYGGVEGSGEECSLVEYAMINDKTPLAWAGKRGAFLCAHFVNAPEDRVVGDNAGESG